MKLRFMFIITLVALSILFAGCSRAVQTNDSNSTGSLGLANPASVYCSKIGGTLQIVNEADGQEGYCHLPSGKVCDEWALYRGECNETNLTTVKNQTNSSSESQNERMQHVCSSEQKTAQVCYALYKPVCGSNGKTYSNDCVACSSGVKSYTDGACQ